MPVRLKDIARDPGLSVVTISKGTSDHPYVGEETRRRSGNSAQLTESA